MAPLSVIKQDSAKPPSRTPNISPRLQRQRTIRAQMERRWLKDAAGWTPETDANEELRYQRTMKAACTAMAERFEGKRVADLGCGAGELAHRLASAGASVDACDIATNALALAKRHRSGAVELSAQCLPDTDYPSKSYDLVVCCDVIAELDARDYRLLVSEMARLVKPEGTLLVSTPIDRRTEQAVERLLSLLETELTITAITTSHHALFQKWATILEFPTKLLTASEDPQQRQQWLTPLTGLRRRLFVAATTAIPAILWRLLSGPCRRKAQALRQSAKAVSRLEKITQAVYRGDRGVTHVIVTGKRKSIFQVGSV